MKRYLLNVFSSILLIASAAWALEPGGFSQVSDQTFVFNVEVLEFSTELGKEIERLVQERARLDRLVVEGKVRPVADLLIRAKSGEPTSVRIGQRVPVQSSSQNAPQVQYENTGLNIVIAPSLTADNRIVASFSLELSSVARIGGTQNPTFFQRTFSEKVRMKPNERIILLSLVQQGSLWPSSSNPPTRDDAYGNFVVLLTARILD